MEEIILKGHKISKGKAAGEALVSHQAIAFYGGVNYETGVVTDKNNELDGISVKGKILVFPVAKGSAANSYRLSKMVSYKTQPKGIINLRADPILAVSAI
ncbi:aconitase X swivel domain-containing protein, partial [Chloroflexota bacterium]